MKEATNGKGFIALYRWKVEPDHLEEFRTRWRALTQKLQLYGALGSCLTKDDSGQFIAIALWPDEQTRAVAFEKIAAEPPWQGAHRISENKLHVEEDHWVNSPFTAAP